MESLKLVIIEDEEAHFQLMKRAIQKELPSVFIDHFNEAGSCIEKLDETHPDLIICDYLMPGMNGIEFLQTMAQKGKLYPVVIITGQGSEDVAVKAMKLGAWDYLVKTGDFFSLLPSTITKVVRERNLRVSLEESARLNETLLNSLPHPAMLVRRDRTILAANRAAIEAGAQIGGVCWRDFGHGDYIPEAHKRYIEQHHGEIPPEGTQCTFCQAGKAMRLSAAANDPEVNAFGGVWDTWWIPVEEDIYFHYATDVTMRKHAERVLRESEEQLRYLSSRLLLAQEDERKRIACELHDSIGSSLSAIKLGMENALSKVDSEAPVRDILESVAAWTGQTIEDIRRIMSDLRPSLLDDLGLVTTIHWFCQRFEKTSPSIRVVEAVEVEESEIPVPLKIVMFRIVQEGLHNVAKYSKANLVTLSLLKENHRLDLVVRDNGVGLDLNAALSERNGTNGIGLRSMKERAELSGGTFSIQSTPGQGTTLRASWPLRQ